MPHPSRQANQPPKAAPGGLLSVSGRAAPDKLVDIAIVDDDASVREALVEILKHVGGFNCVGAYGSGAEALAQIPHFKPDVVLMDIRMPGMSGIECTRRLIALSPKLKILILTALPDADLIPEALRAGAAGYIAKPYQLSELLDSIRLAVFDDGAPLCHVTVRRLMSLLARAPAVASLMAALTDREREIVQCLETGLQYKETADRLGISLATVRQHAHHIYEKLHVHTRIDALNKLYPRNKR